MAFFITFNSFFAISILFSGQDPSAIPFLRDPYLSLDLLISAMVPGDKYPSTGGVLTNTSGVALSSRRVSVVLNRRIKNKQRKLFLKVRKFKGFCPKIGPNK